MKLSNGFVGNLFRIFAKSNRRLSNYIESRINLLGFPSLKGVDLFRLDAYLPKKDPCRDRKFHIFHTDKPNNFVVVILIIYVKVALTLAI